MRTMIWKINHSQLLFRLKRSLKLKTSLFKAVKRAQSDFFNLTRSFTTEEAIQIEAKSSCCQLLFQ